MAMQQMTLSEATRARLFQRGYFVDDGEDFADSGDESPVSEARHQDIGDVAGLLPMLCSPPSARGPRY